MVVCWGDNGYGHYKTTPIITIKVLSRTTRKFDQKLRLLHCQSIFILAKLLLIDEDNGKIQVFSR